MYSGVGFQLPATSAVGGSATAIALRETGATASYPLLDIAVLIVAAFTVFYAVLAMRNLLPVRATTPGVDVPTRTRPTHRAARRLRRHVR